MLVTFMSAPGSATRPSEDIALAAENIAVVLDGAGGPSELGSGCIHGTPWYVRNLGTRLLEHLLNRTNVALSEALADAIGEVAMMHTDTCDLNNPGTPSATVAILRKREHDLDYLVLSDAVMVFEGAKGTHFVSDRRIDQLGAPIRAKMNKLETGSPEHQEQRLKLVTEQRRLRNKPGGHWVAAQLPEAATHALTGSIPSEDAHHIALMSDGGARYVDLQLGDWKDLMAVLTEYGPQEVISKVREAERADAGGRIFPRTKQYDDATILFATLTPNPPAGN